jgi:probable F420-dependent oxidoreductase
MVVLRSDAAITRRVSAGYPRDVNSAIPLGIGIPQAFPNTTIEPDSIKAFLQRAEALGFDGAWTQENPLGRMPTLDSVHLLTFAAAHTSRMRIGCAVHLTAVHSPVHLAKSLMTIDRLSSGRLIVGVGLGTPRQDSAFGVDSSTRVARFAEGVRLMKALWTEPEITFQGRYFQLEKAAMEPKPVQKPHPPIWFGGSHPNALRRAVRLGDGFIGAGSTSSSAFADQVRTMRTYFDELGRDPATFPISKRVYFAVDDNKQRAGDKLAAWFTFNYGRSQHEQVAVWGPPDECAARLREIADSGAGMIVLTTLFDFDEQLERIAADVAPKLG